MGVGILGNMKFGLRKKNKVFNFGGVFWGTCNLDLGRKTKFSILGGAILENMQFGLRKKNKVFNLGGVYSGEHEIWT